MELSFDDAKSKDEKMVYVSKYLSPGINVPVKVKEITQGKSSKKQSPYVEITIEGVDGKTCSHQYYINTEVGKNEDGTSKKTSAWAISKDAILQLITATTGLDDETAKTKLVGINDENIASKLSTIMVGKPFAIVLGGEWINPKDAQKQPWIKAEFGSGNFATTVANASELKYNASKAIKGTPAPTSAGDPANNLNDAGNISSPTKVANW